jgi:hypothetical protein
MLHSPEKGVARKRLSGPAGDIIKYALFTIKQFL